MANKLDVFSEDSYKEILKEVGPFRYSIYDPGELVPGNIFSKALNLENYNCVVAGTGSTLAFCDLTLPNSKRIVIPKDSPVIVVRLLHEDTLHGTPHYNADDQIIFPTLQGNIFRLPRKDAPDHYREIVGTTNLFSIATAYQLPSSKSGPISQYTENGARLHIELSPQVDTWD